MAYNNVASLTPSRPAPAPPARPPLPSGSSPSTSSGLRETQPIKSQFSSTAYAASFPIINPSSALAPININGGPRNTVVRTGPASVKEEGIRSFLWSKRWLVLGGAELSVFKNEVRHLSQKKYEVQTDGFIFSPLIAPPLLPSASVPEFTDSNLPLPLSSARSSKSSTFSALI